MRILWLGNAPHAPSGYANQTALFVPRLAALGHELAISANWGIEGAVSGWGGFTLYPADGVWNNTNIATHAEHHEADLVIALCDAWVMNPDQWPDLEMAIWAPVDHYPIPPAVLAVLAHDRVRPIAMSRNGEALMGEAGLDPAYVPHGIDTSIFRPMPDLRDKIRDALDIPRDAFLVGMVGANRGNPLIPRKGFPQAFHAFSRFAAEHDDARMYVHTMALPDRGNGIDLDALARVTGCPPGSVRFPSLQAWHLGIGPEQMGVLYAAFDVLLNPSWGEGFGIPIMEAQACGVPVIVSDHSAMSELCGAGWKVGGDPWWHTAGSAFFVMPSIDGIVQALEQAYEQRGDYELRDAAVEFAQAYDADHVTERYWKPALEKLTLPREVAPLNGGKPEPEPDPGEITLETVL